MSNGRLTVKLSREQSRMVAAIRERVEQRTGRQLSLDGIMTYALHYARATESGYLPADARDDALVLAEYDGTELDTLVDYIASQETGNGTG